LTIDRYVQGFLMFYMVAWSMATGLTSVNDFRSSFVIVGGQPDGQRAQSETYPKSDCNSAQRILFNPMRGVIKQILSGIAAAFGGAPGGSHPVVYGLPDPLLDAGGFEASIGQAGTCELRTALYGFPKSALSHGGSFLFVVLPTHTIRPSLDRPTWSVAGVTPA
jgi:hypothetical protein